MPLKKVQQRLRRHARIRTGISGSGNRPRLSVFRSLNHIHVQLIDDGSGKVLAASSSLKMKGDPKTIHARKVGLEIALKAKAAGIETCVFDRGGYLYHGRIKALAEGAREGGLKF